MGKYSSQVTKKDTKREKSIEEKRGKRGMWRVIVIIGEEGYGKHFRVIVFLYFLSQPLIFAIR